MCFRGVALEGGLKDGGGFSSIKYKIYLVSAVSTILPTPAYQMSGGLAFVMFETSFRT